MRDHSARSVTFTRTYGRRYSERTEKILQYLASHPRGESVQNIADFVKGPYNSVLKTLLRLTEKDIVKHPQRGVFMLNHEDPLKLTTTSEKCHFVGLHGVGLVADVPRLWDRLLESGTLTPVDLKGGGYYHDRGFLPQTYLRLFRESAYYQEKCPPFPLQNVMLRYEDMLKALSFYTRDLADVKGVWLNDYEISLDVPHDLFFFRYLNIKKIVIYPPDKGKHGTARVHVQFNQKMKPLPLDRDTTIFMHADLSTAMTEAQDILETSIRTLIKPHTFT